mmetsp:Transcript_65726/g.212089  ORF Transcript_65726/g.212089 Transcript_65726/m.212089 type:complete len:239 (-) Transcript_65726:93-809(-)
MARQPRSGPAVLLLLAAALAALQVALRPSQPFVAAPFSAVARNQALSTARRAEEGEDEEDRPDWIIEIPDRGIDLDGDKLDNLDEWYQETISGKGGMPKGFMRDLILRSFFGEFDPRGYLLPSREFTGPNKQPCATDYETAYQTMKSNMKEGKFMRGDDDGLGWIWLACDQPPFGLRLYLTKSPPYGERPLAIIKQSNVDEFFDNVDWHRLFVRLHKWNLWGGKVTKFPYPIKGKYED